jgi:hypothetical protein
MKEKCKQCVLENNNGICDRKDCLNHSQQPEECAHVTMGTGKKIFVPCIKCGDMKLPKLTPVVAHGNVILPEEQWAKLVIYLSKLEK